MFDSH
jgi:hypothetical protein